MDILTLPCLTKCIIINNLCFENVSIQDQNNPLFEYHYDNDMIICF